MALPSTDLSDTSNIEVIIPEEMPKIGKPNLIDYVNAEHAQKLKAVKHTLYKVGDDPFQGLAVIDAVQRLGIDYLFQNEIMEILRKQYMIYTTHGYDHPNNLQEVALRFRLLRQEGYYVSSDIFNNFKNNEGESNRSLSEDINGLVSLYEASHLSIGGEDVLDEAREFVANLLNELCVKHLDDYQARLVQHILAHPYRKSLLSRFMANSFTHSEHEWTQDLQQLAKMDFNMVQSLHQKEIIQISKWWIELGLSKKLAFARDQPLKWYMWSRACFTDPSMMWQRIEFTKPISLIYIIDDVFDINGTLDELTLFTETINSWDLVALDQLPDYMKFCFEALNDITNEISSKVYEVHGHNPVHSLRKAWASLCNAFLVEAKWFSSGYFPKTEEYLKNGIISSGVHVGLVHIFYLLGEGITSESVELIDNNPPIISSIATILRLWDDLGTAKDENQDGKDGSYIYYYMEEHKESTAEDAQKHAMEKISDAWKNLNKACLCPNPFSASFTRASLNVARMVPLMYNYDDKQRLPSLEVYIKSLFKNLPARGVY